MSTRPPAPTSRKESNKDNRSLGGGRNRVGGKISLTRVQEVKVQIIDWKRFSVRWLLLLAYCTLGHLIAYVVIMSNAYHTIFESPILKTAFLGFIADLLLYFFGTCASVNAITYAWNPVKFIIGIVTIILGILGNLYVYYLGDVNIDDDPNSNVSTGFKNGVSNRKDALCTKLRDKELNFTEADIADEDRLWGFLPFNVTCEEIKTARTSLMVIPYVLPGVALLCIIGACFGALEALYLVPKKVKDSKIDAAWLEPYETYDFYVGRNIPRIPGYDGQYEGTVVDTSKYMADSDDDDSDEEDLEDGVDAEGHHHDKHGRVKKSKNKDKAGKTKTGPGGAAAGAHKRTGAGSRRSIAHPHQHASPYGHAH